MCALSRGQSALSEEEKTREAGGLAKPLAWCPLEGRSLAEEKFPRQGSLGLESPSRLGEPGP